MPTGLLRRDGGRYYIRRRVPVDLIEHYGRAEIVKALGTSDPAEARKRRAVLWVELDRQFDEARSAKVAPEAADDPASRERPLEDISPTVISLINLDTLRDERDAAAREGRLKEFMDDRRDALRLMQAMLDGERDPTDDLRVIEGKRNALRAMLTGENAFAISAARKAREAINHSATVERRGAATSFDALVEKWAAGRTLTRKAKAAHQSVATWFVERVGDKAIEAISKGDVVKFKDALVNEGQSPANINVKLTRLRTLLSHARRNDLIATNPAADVRVVDKRSARSKRKEFSQGELAVLFSGPVHTKGTRPLGGGGEAAYWLPLLALFTGARQTELGQLHPDDVHQEAYFDGDGGEHSAWVIRIADNAERGQRVKTEGSERRIPIHAALIELGFLDVVERARKERRSRVFHEIKPGAHGELMGRWSKWFARYRREVGVAARDTPFHSFRHSFKHYARVCRISKEVSDVLTGHETGDTGDTYGALAFPLAPLVEGIKAYRVPGLKLPPPPH